MSLAVHALDQRAFLDSMFANRVLVVEVSVNRSSSPLAHPLKGCLTTLMGDCATGRGLLLTMSDRWNFPRQVSTRPDPVQSPLSRLPRFEADSTDAMAEVRPRGVESQQWKIPRANSAAGIVAMDDRNSDRVGCFLPLLMRHFVRLSPRKATDEKRDVDQCDPAGRMPDRHC